MPTFGFANRFARKGDQRKHAGASSKKDSEENSRKENRKGKSVETEIAVEGDTNVKQSAERKRGHPRVTTRQKIQSRRSSSTILKLKRGRPSRHIRRADSPKGNCRKYPVAEHNLAC